MSKSTIVSVIPFPLVEVKPGIYPGKFEIPAAGPDSFQLLVIGNSKYHVEVDEGRTITVTAESEDIAKSIIEDYVIAQIGFSREEDTAPGIFWVPGEHDQTSILIKYSIQLQGAKDRQDRWFKKLVQVADDDWERSRQHRAISDVQRYAAKSLGLDKPWIIAPIPMTISTLKCVACQSLVTPETIVCPSCKCILNPEKYKNLQFATK